MTPEIRTQIEDAALNEICNPERGDCITVAAAIQEVFGGVPLVFYVSPEREDVMHAVVEIDEQLYDGSGKRKLDFLLHD